MSWRDIIKGDAWEMEQDTGMSGADIVSHYASRGGVIITDPKTNESADYEEIDDGDGGQLTLDDWNTHTTEGSRLHKWTMENKYINEDDIKEAESMGFDVQR